ncbi:MAG: glycosyltransferase family 4 protein [Anaerovoracaceae bacterium]
MTRICHLTSVHKSNDVRIFRKECSSLAKNPDYDVFLVARGDSREENGVHVVGVGEYRGGRIGRAKYFSEKVVKTGLAINADIYHLHDPELLRFALELKKNGKIVIFDSHEDYANQLRIKPYIPAPLRPVIAGTYHLFETGVAKKIDAVIIPTEQEGDGNYFRGRCRRCVTVGNTPVKSEIYDRFDDDRDYSRKKVCYVGGLHKNRGIVQLVKGCYCAGADLILGGPFENEEFEKEVKSMPEYRCVDYRGVCDRDQVVEILREAGIGASTLLNVGQYSGLTNLATKVYEYMSAGLPVISYSYPYIENLTQEYPFAELVDSGSYYSIAKAVEKLSEDGELRRRMGNIGRQLIRDRFNWDFDEKNLFDLYESLLKERG